jgi:hypothetical protein
VLGLLPRSPELHSESTHLGYVVVAQGQVFVNVLWSPSVSIILAMLHTHLHYNASIIRRRDGLSPGTFSLGSENAGTLQIEVLPYGLLLFGAVNRFLSRLYHFTSVSYSVSYTKLLLTEQTGESRSTFNKVILFQQSGWGGGGGGWGGGGGQK